MRLRFTLAAAIVSVSLGAVASSNLITGDGGRAGTPADLSKFNMARVIYDSEGGMAVISHLVLAVGQRHIGVGMAELHGVDVELGPLVGAEGFGGRDLQHDRLR